MAIYYSDGSLSALLKFYIIFFLLNKENMIHFTTYHWYTFYHFPTHVLEVGCNCGTGKEN